MCWELGIRTRGSGLEDMVRGIWFRTLGPFFHKFFTPDPKEKRRFLPGSTPALRIRGHFCLILFVVTSQLRMTGYQP